MDKTKVTPDAEEIASKGTVAEITKEEIITHPNSPEKAPETVPLSVFLALKDDLKDLKKEIKESSKNKSTVTAEGVKDLAEKYPDVSPEFIEDMLSSATTKAVKQVEEKYTPLIQKQEMEEKKKAFDIAFDGIYNKALKENPDLPENIDKEAIKTLALTPAYRDVPISEILTNLYGVQKGKPSTENDMRPSSDIVTDVVDFSKVTPEQKEAILADPKARKEYFAYLDTK